MTDQPQNSQQPFRPVPNRPQHYDDIDLTKYFYLFLANWYWFALALFLSVSMAYFVNRYSTKVYKVTASLLIEDETRNPYGMGASMFGGNNMMSGLSLSPNNNNFQNQILIMKSESLISRTLHELDFCVSYYKDELSGPRETWDEIPFVVIPDYDKLQHLGINFVVTIKNDGTLKLESKDTDDKIELYNYRTEKSSDGATELILNQVIRFNEKIEGDGFSFAIVPRHENRNNGKIKTGTWIFSFESYESLINKWTSALNLKSLDKESSIASLDIETSCPAKAQLFLNKHLDIYLKRTLEKKNMFATNTINFIDKQLTAISDSLDITGMNLQDYRRNNQVVDLSFQAQQLFEQAKDLDNQKATLKIKDDYFRYLMEYLRHNREAGDLVAPSVIGIDDPLLNSLVLEINKMADQKTAMKGTGQSENPYLLTIEAQISNAKSRLEENAQNLLRNNDLAISDVEKRLGSLMDEIRKLPQTERELLGIERRFKLNDNIYTYMLQRRAEAQITKASNTPGNEIIDYAKVIKPNIRPVPHRNYTIGLFLGLLLPGLVLIIIDSLNNKVTSEDDVKKISDLSVAGHIIHSTDSYQTVVLNDPKSQVAETFRILRTRLQFFTKETKSPLILLTSSMPAEGKTFASINLASAYSLIGRRAVLVGFDLRKPKIYNDFNLKEEKGISTYLIGQNTLDEIIQESGFPNLSVITAGPIPPNPSELAGSSKTVELFTELKKRFDYIIVDSAPLGAVSDTFSLAAISDITIILVRHNKTIRQILKNTLADAKTNGISGISLLLNDISRDKGIYGYVGKYRYGYGYGYSNVENSKNET